MKRFICIAGSTGCAPGRGWAGFCKGNHPHLHDQENSSGIILPVL